MTNPEKAKAPTEQTWRTGKKVGRTIYFEGDGAGMSGSIGDAPSALTVGDLRKAILGLPDGLPVLVAIIHGEGDEYHVGSMISARVDSGCIADEALLITGDEDS